MAGKNRTYVARYPGYQEVSVTLHEFQITKADMPGSMAPPAQRGIMAEFKRAFLQQHGRQITNWLDYDKLELEETFESQNQPSGCGCECAGCDQGHHCRKEDRGCYM